jgi:predicted enzyme related to lactoylglutathione lyase
MKLQEPDAVTDIRRLFSTIALCAAALAPVAIAAEPPGRITGVGGIFFKSKDPKALMAWYRDVLGIKVEPWGGAVMVYDAPKHPPAVIVNAFGAATDYMDPSKREFMINFAVDDLSAFIARLKAKGVAVLKRDDSDPSGNFAWIVDPDGTKIELWEPKAGTAKK